jgi:undecaprenyl-diphosphatase
MGYPSKRSFLARRLSRHETLGLHLTIGLLLCLLLVGLFALLAALVEGPQPPRVDVRIYNALREHREQSPVVGTTIRRITDFGDVPLLMPLGVSVVGILLVRRKWELAAAWVGIVLLGVVLNDEAKDLFHRERPLVYAGDVNNSSYSFPSGHSMAAMISYGLLGYLVLLAFPSRRRLRTTALVCLALIVLVVGFTRMYLSAHWLTDVLGGFLLGAGWLALWIGLLECGRRHRLLQKQRADAAPFDDAA